MIMNLTKMVVSKNEKNCWVHQLKRPDYDIKRSVQTYDTRFGYKSAPTSLSRKRKGEDDWKISRRCAIAIPSKSVEERFFELAKQWKRETAYSSLANEKVTNQNYSTIIGMGITFKDKIIKLILQDLERYEEYWHYALKSITNENPVPKGRVNNLSIVRECWLNWGKENQLI
jgi:hypothetical protein